MFLRLSLRHRLTLVLIASSACGLVLTGAGLVAYDTRTARAQLTSELEGVARLVASNSDAALTFGDADAAQVTLWSLGAREDVLGAGDVGEGLVHAGERRRLGVLGGRR